jgi:predicted nuclease of predicted toxin-antitoxin system
LVTQDKDFGELAIVFEHPHAGILRLDGIPAPTSRKLIPRCYGCRRPTIR